MGDKELWLSRDFDILMRLEGDGKGGRGMGLGTTIER